MRRASASTTAEGSSQQRKLTHAQRLATAEERRTALQELERNRLHAEHELVLARLAQSREKEDVEVKRTRLEARLKHASEVRRERMSMRAAAAASHAAHVREAGDDARQRHAREAEAKRAQLEERMQAANERRTEALILLSPSPRLRSGLSASSTSSAPSGRPSFSGSFAVGANAPAAAATAAAGGSSSAGPAVDARENTDGMAAVTPSPSRSTAMGIGMGRVHASNELPAGEAIDSPTRGDCDADAADAAPAYDPELYPRVEGLRRHVSVKKLQQCWRSFAKRHHTTRALAAAFIGTGITMVKLTEGQQQEAGAGTRHAPTAPVAIAGAQSHSRNTSLPAAPYSPFEVEFDTFAEAMRNPATIKAATTLMRRLEARLVTCGAPTQSVWSMLRRLYPKSPAYAEAEAGLAPTRRPSSLATLGSAAASGAATPARAPDRYPARVMLTAWMVVRYPEVVFSNVGGRVEQSLAELASQLVSTFEALLSKLVDASEPEPDDGAGLDLLAPSPLTVGARMMRQQLTAGRSALIALPGRGNGAVVYPTASPRTSLTGTTSGTGGPLTPGRAPGPGSVTNLLLWFDEVYLQYLDQFVAWKTHDAASLEAELVGMAAKLEKSLRRKLAHPPPSPRNNGSNSGSGAGSPRVTPSGVAMSVAALSSSPGAATRSLHDLQAMEDQVAHDHKLLRSRIAKLSGPSGVERLDAAIAAARAQVEYELAPVDASDASASESESERPKATDAQPGDLPPRARKPPGGLTRGFFGAAKPKPAAAAGAAAAGAAAPPPPRTQEPGLSAGAVANLGMVQDLLHDPAKRLPNEELDAAITALLAPPAADTPTTGTPSAAASSAGAPPGLMVDPSELEGLDGEAAVALLKARARAAAEKLFWDGVVAKAAAALAPGAPPAALLAATASLALEVGRDAAAEVADPQLRAQLSAEFEYSNGGGPGSDQELSDRLEDAARAAAVAAGQGRASKSAQGAAAAVAAADARLVPRALPGLLLLLERLGALLVEYGAPVRATQALATQQTVRDELSDALSAYAAESAAAAAAPPPPQQQQEQQAPSPQARALARCLCTALQLLHLQLRQLKLDAANARLSMLAAQLRGSSGVAYVRDKFRLLHRLPPLAPPLASDDADTPTAAPAAPAPERIAAACPRTWAWLQAAARGAPSIRGYCASTLGLSIDDAVTAAGHSGHPRLRTPPSATPAAAGLPTVLRSGLRSTGPSAAAGADERGEAASVAPEVLPALPVPLASARGLVRAGLVSLVSGGTPAAGAGLPETLQLDAERLHASQNAFQQLVVVAASFLLAQQSRSGHGAAAAAAAAAAASSAPSPQLPPASPQLPSLDARAAKRRLRVLLADPSLNIGHLVTELSLMAGLADAGLTQEEQVKAEAALKTALLKVLDPAGPAYRSLANGLSAALLLHMLLGCDSGASPQSDGDSGPPDVPSLVSRILGRLGASILTEDVMALGAQLLGIAGVSEGVHLPEVYEPLARLALEQQAAAVAQAQAQQAQQAQA